MGEAAYADGEWESADGLKLHYRDYPGRSDRPPILCIPGLTRNARDFEPVADAFGGEWRVICLNLRGRGNSDYAKDSSTYTPLQYVEDVERLFEHLGLGKVVALGTSLGGIVTMLLAMRDRSRLAGAIINDIGPEIDAAGLQRIREYVGQGRSFPTWMHAARSLRDQWEPAYPDFEIADWLRVTKRLMCVGGNGRIAFDYDMKIAEPFGEPGNEAPVDLWPVFKALSGLPLLVIRGELSDILSASTVEKMKQEMPGMRALTIPRVGHAPTLEEPAAQEAIAGLLAEIA